MITIITLSNKRDLIVDAVRSIVDQSRPVRHVWAMDGIMTWSESYPPAVWANWDAQEEN